MNIERQEEKRIEIEFRSILEEKKYKALEEFLKEKGEDKGEDDKDVFFFILKDKLMKVVNNVSRKNAVLVMKLNKIGKGSDFEEIEIFISQSSVNDMVRVLKALGITDNIMQSFQKRHNYLYKGVEISLKYSDVWGFHAEFEIIVGDEGKKIEAEEKIKKIAEELDVHLMSDDELLEFTQNAEKKYQEENKQK